MDGLLQHRAVGCVAGVLAGRAETSPVSRGEESDYRTGYRASGEGKERDRRIEDAVNQPMGLLEKGTDEIRKGRIFPLGEGGLEFMLNLVARVIDNQVAPDLSVSDVRDWCYGNGNTYHFRFPGTYIGCASEPVT